MKTLERVVSFLAAVLVSSTPMILVLVLFLMAWDQGWGLSMPTRMAWCFVLMLAASTSAWVWSLVFPLFWRMK